MACKRWRAKPFRLMLMPNLPESRVRKSSIFEQVGLDYLGPLSIRADKYRLVKNRVVKRWTALFTCFITRTVHLPVESVENLSS